MLVGLVRHGLTDWNLAGKIQGQTDIPLNDEGREQARLLAERLMEDSKYAWDFVISSNLQRAQETGQIIADALQIPLHDPDSRLVERSFGRAEGLTVLEREKLWGKNWSQQDFGQEKDTAVRERALAFMNDLLHRYPDNNVLVISHGGLLAQLYIALYNNQFNERIGNLSLTIVENKNKSWEMLLYNCTRHLQEMTECSK